jgi:hypothetical protein
MEGTSTMTAKKQPGTSDERTLFQALTPEERRERILQMPGVIVHTRDPNWTHWTFEPWIRVREGFDVNAAIEREQEEDALEFLKP